MPDGVTFISRDFGVVQAVPAGDGAAPDERTVRVLAGVGLDIPSRGPVGEWLIEGTVRWVSGREEVPVSERIAVVAARE